MTLPPLNIPNPTSITPHTDGGVTGGPPPPSA